MVDQKLEHIKSHIFKMWVWIGVQLEQHPQIQQWKHDATQTWLKYAPPPTWTKVRARQELIQTHQTKTRFFWTALLFIKSKCILTMKEICVNPLVLVMGCIFVVRPFINNNISMATIALWQLTRFWRVSNLGGKDLSFFSIVEQ
jgi:hypothetical protein